jgi:hypothetical protein
MCRRAILMAMRRISCMDSGSRGVTQEFAGIHFLGLHQAQS